MIEIVLKGENYRELHLTRFLEWY